MEPDILIIDEVLAVGDAEFQRKCLGKMEEVTSKDERTVLFVSHNLDAVRRICKKTIWINEGTVMAYGETSQVLAAYARHGNAATDTSIWINPGTLKQEYFEPTRIEFAHDTNEIQITGILHKEADDITIGRLS